MSQTILEEDNVSLRRETEDLKKLLVFANEEKNSLTNSLLKSEQMIKLLQLQNQQLYTELTESRSREEYLELQLQQVSRQYFVEDT